MLTCAARILDRCSRSSHRLHQPSISFLSTIVTAHLASFLNLSHNLRNIIKIGLIIRWQFWKFTLQYTALVMLEVMCDFRLIANVPRWLVLLKCVVITSCPLDGVVLVNGLWAQGVHSVHFKLTLGLLSAHRLYQCVQTLDSLLIMGFVVFSHVEAFLF
jgi:hypothetical protein